MAVSRYIPDTSLQNQSEAGRKENPETREPGILPRPLESEVSKKKSFSKVCMELSFESGFREKNIPRNPADLFLGSPANLEDRGLLERSGSISCLSHQLKRTHLFSSHNVIPSLLATGTAGSGECISPDPLPMRQTRKRELRNAPAAPDESEPRRKVMLLDRDVSPPPPSSLLLSTPALPDSKLPLPSKLPLRSLVRAESLPESAPPTDTSTLLDPGQTEQSNTALVMSLLLQLARAYTLLSRYDYSRAVAAFKSLPKGQYRTPWVLCQMAKAHFERANYQISCRLFKEARALDPDHLTDMDVYSTALWHLHNVTELSALSEDLADFRYLSPQALCAKGNCLSIHNEHEDAIKFFQRATQVAPRFVYAYTLLGHGYLCTNDFSNAKKCFRTAATINPRHYNAFFGLGKISQDEEDYRAAEKYFKIAFSLNSSSCIICSRLAHVKHSLHRSSEALEFLEQARKLNPKSPVPLYHKASTLHDLKRSQEALEILENLCNPHNILEYFLMKKLYQKLGINYEANHTPSLTRITFVTFYS